MKGIHVVAFLFAAAFAAPLNQSRGSCGNSKRETGVVARVLLSALDTLKDKREVTEVDVDEISQALYSSWCTP
ncbi:hypothetical protein C8A01DRAFT_21305 [Parachaetomium inaequale]|uniref:Uncharacterized protein n=1 Tax=Parachaetomium inaequale TaxID=2588326 RepID=A0AAN6SLG9_9PEZI|nr:hypothetical protein C8A01DRAFT_21305 [Parachaetomium inaequale]